MGEVGGEALKLPQFFLLDELEYIFMIILKKDKLF